MQEESKSFLRSDMSNSINKFQQMAAMKNPFAYQSIKIQDQIIQRTQAKIKIQQQDDTIILEDGVELNDLSVDQNQNNVNSSINKNQNKRIKREVAPKCFGIIIYSTYIMLSGAYLIYYYFNQIYDGFTRTFLDYFIQFNLILCLYSYYKTIKISNKITKVKKQQIFEKRDHFDNIYQLTDRYCQICADYKYPRVSHCSTCQQCVYSFDHHCVWTQNCIGYKNQKTFYLFTVYMTIEIIQFIIGSVYYFSFLLEKPNFWEVNEPVFYIFWIVNILSIPVAGIMVMFLSIFHTQLMFNNITTLDTIKCDTFFQIPLIQIRKKNLSQVNYFDRGEIVNFINILGNNIFTFWIPFQRKLKSEIISQKMNPEPTKRQLMLWNEQFAQNQANIQLKRNNFNLQDLKRQYKGKKIRINNLIILYE